MRVSIPILVFVAFHLLGARLLADEVPAPAPTLPPKALIAGVPYVSWSEAAQWRYEKKHILNPSYIASAKMIRRYWQDQVALTGDNRLVFIRDTIHMAWRTVIGYDDERQVMVLHDPSFGPAWDMAYADFEPNWRLHGFTYIALPPQGYADFVAKRAPSAAYPARTPDMRAAVHFAFGYGYAEVGRGADAEREFEAGLALAGLGNGYRHVIALELAHHRQKAGRIEDAIALLRQAIDALPEAPGPYELLSEIYKTNPSLAGARQAALDNEQSYKSRFNSKQAMGVVLRAIPRDFLMPVFSPQRGWACEPDYRASRC